MSKFSPYRLVKDQAKTISNDQNISLSSAQERVALNAGFSHFHELTTVAQRNPLDARLLKAAFGVSELREALWVDNVWQMLDGQLEESLSGEMADMNAHSFGIDEADVSTYTYDENLGKLILEVSLTYAGEQDQDRPYHGTAFYVEGRLNLFRREGEWSFGYDGGLEILSIETDSDRDHIREVDDLYQMYLNDQ